MGDCPQNTIAKKSVGSTSASLWDERTAGHYHVQWEIIKGKKKSMKAGNPGKVPQET